MTTPRQTLASLVSDRAASHPHDTALRFKSEEAWQEQTWSALAHRVEKIAAGLLTCGVDLQPGDAVAILAETSPDWIAVDFAALSIGALTVPIYTSLPAPEVGYVHVDAAVKVLFVENADQLAKVSKVREGFELVDVEYAPTRLVLEHIVVLDATGLNPGDGWESLAELERRGREALSRMRQVIAGRRSAVDPDAVATFTYTSGTTGPPKAVLQTSNNHLAMIRSVHEAGLLTDDVRDGGMFLFLPLAHSFGRLVQFLAPALNLPIVISSVPTLAADIVQARPGFVPGAPRVFEKIKAAVEQQSAVSQVKKTMLRLALRSGRAAAEYRITAEPAPLGTRLRYRLADRAVLSKVRAKLGLDRAHGLLSGAAPLRADVQWFFLSLGLDLYEAYGLTETCPGLSANRPGAVRIGTVGKPLPGVKLRIGPDAEILARGPNITRGYHNRPVETSEAIDDDGWFHTGDNGSIDADGYLTITGRAKELIKTSGGKYVAPAKIEGALRACPLIQEAVLVGDGHNFCTALIAIDDDALALWADARSLPADQNHTAVTTAIQTHVDTLNSTLASFESIKRWAIIDPPTIESGLLTASLKVKRQAVIERAARQIQLMYASS